MISVYLECRDDERDALIAELHDRGTAGVLELASGLRAWFEDGLEVRDLVERFDGHVLPEQEEDWEARTRESFPPIAIGERFWLVPPWNDEPPPAGRLRLEINPGLACGTGWHQCTQLCLAAMERYLRRGDAFLDVGTGSAILSVAAVLLGARVTIGCDIDLDSVAVARDRIGACVFAGSSDAVASRAFAIVAANISAPVVTALLPDLRRVCRPGGLLILSGFTTIATPEGTLAILDRDGWRCVIVKP